jgi:hypothetical protein
MIPCSYLLFTSQSALAVLVDELTRHVVHKAHLTLMSQGKAKLNKTTLSKDAISAAIAQLGLAAYDVYVE